MAMTSTEEEFRKNEKDKELSRKLEARIITEIVDSLEKTDYQGRNRIIDYICDLYGKTPY